jgi:hypothetical protein
VERRFGIRHGNEGVLTRILPDELRPVEVNRLVHEDGHSGDRGDPEEEVEPDCEEDPPWHETRL